MSDAPGAPRADAVGPASLRPGATLDLSTGRPPSKVARKGPPPVVVKTINLSTPKPPKPPKQARAEPTPALRSAPTASSASRPGQPAPRSGSQAPKAERPAPARPSSGNSLADLLDAETLARLRGR